MIDYEEYFMFDDNFMLKENFHPDIMGKMLLKKKTDDNYFSKVTKYELLDYIFVISEYMDLLNIGEFDDEYPGEKIDEKITKDLKMCYVTFVNNYMNDSDALFIVGFIMDVYTWAFDIGSSIPPVIGLNYDDVRNKGRDYRKQAEIMKNPIAIAFNSIDDHGSNLSIKARAAIQYMEYNFPESYTKKKVYLYLKELCEGCNIEF